MMDINRLVKNLFVALKELRDLVINNQIPQLNHIQLDLQEQCFDVKILRPDFTDGIRFELLRKNNNFNLYPCCVIFGNYEETIELFSYVKLINGKYPYYKLSYQSLDDIIMLSLSNQDISLFGIESECISALVTLFLEKNNDECL